MSLRFERVDVIQAWIRHRFAFCKLLSMHLEWVAERDFLDLAAHVSIHDEFVGGQNHRRRVEDHPNQVEPHDRIDVTDRIRIAVLVIGGPTSTRSKK